MPNQRDIARTLGLTQATVSLALRGDPSIPPGTRRLVEATARKLGYRPNPMVSALMEHIRSGRDVKDRGCIAVLVDAASEKDWVSDGPGVYDLQHQGYRQRAALRGYRTECFFLRAPGMSPEIIDRQLYSRGITGLILAAPKRADTPPVSMRWGRYACVTVSYSWATPAVDRVSSHHRHSVEMAFQKIQERGYRRIGMCLPSHARRGVDSSWIAGLLVCQSDLPVSRRIPLFVGRLRDTSLAEFKAWYDRWRPDALITLLGEEWDWIQKMGLTEDDIGFVCLNRPSGSHFSGIDENNLVVAATACDLVVTQITHNERGLPEHPKVILVESMWIDGETLPDKRKAAN